MLVSAIFAFAHHVAAFGLVACVVAELVLINGELTLASARHVQRIDMIFGLLAGVLLIVGLHRVFLFEKGFEYYSASAFFWAKMALFVAVAIASIAPTVEFLSWRKATRQGRVPAPDAKRLRLLRSIMHGELAGIVLIILCAAMMARGIEIF